MHLRQVFEEVSTADVLIPMTEQRTKKKKKEEKYAKNTVHI